MVNGTQQPQPITPPIDEQALQRSRAEQRQRLIDVIAPPAIRVNADYLEIGNVLVRTLFISSYPKFMAQNWLSPIINLGRTIDTSIFIQPVSSETILKRLEDQLTSVEVERSEREQKGFVRDPMLDAAYQNIEELRDKLQTAEERVFKFGLYLVLYAKNKDELEDTENEIRSILESKLVYPKPALYQQREGFLSGMPLGTDALKITTSLNTAPLSSTFPFVSFDLSDNKGILYGVNMHNSSLILFDRFSLENANMVILGKAGGGKSYAIKLELLRSMMLGTDIIVIDPEGEYQYLAEATGGSFFRVSLTSGDHINPFDIPEPQKDENPAEIYRATVITLLGLIKLMVGALTPEEESVLNEAINQTYASRDITPDTTNFWEKTPPLMQDLQVVLQNMEGGEGISKRLEKYTKGVFSGFLNEQTNIKMQNQLVVFNIRDMQEVLRPIAMYIIVNYVWGNIRKELKKRILAIDEAWWMLQHTESAAFLFGIAKRARKYYLGVSTISQDIADFLSSDYGKAIITNSSLQLLMKQAPATIDQLQKTFNLSDEEKYMLMETNIGEGLFFAGTKHVAIKVVPSYIEDRIITTNPEEVLQLRKEGR
jgi:type IV secretory pathway VirB4 component